MNEALADWETYSNRFAQAMQSKPPAEVAKVAKEGHRQLDTMLTADPPEQRRYRKLVNKSFTMRAVESIEPRIREIAAELADGFAGQDRVELPTAFAQPLPLTVIAEQLGAPREDLHLFRRWTDGFVAQLGLMADLEGQVEAARLIVEFQKYFVDRLEERRTNPQRDILSGIVHAHVGEDERELDTAECLSILQQLLVAGNETTAAAISEGMWLLARHPEQQRLLQEDPSKIPNAVEEILRYATPTANMWRVTTKDAELGGVEIPAGSMMLLRYAAANRDPEVFADPDRFDVERANAPEHIAFGPGHPLLPRRQPRTTRDERRVRDVARPIRGLDRRSRRARAGPSPEHACSGASSRLRSGFQQRANPRA